jgi:hypothetical protein
VQNIRRERFLFAQEPEKEMLRSDVLVVEPFGFLRAIGKHPLAFVAEGKIDGSRHLFPHGGLRFDLLANRFHGRAGAQEPIGENFVFPQEPQQQMLRLDTGAAELAGLVTGEEDHSPGFLGITFKHNSCLVPNEVEAEPAWRERRPRLHRVPAEPVPPSTLLPVTTPTPDARGR